MGGSLYGLMVIGGPILLAAVLLFVILSNRKHKATKAQTERATRDLHDELNAEDTGIRKS